MRSLGAALLVSLLTSLWPQQDAKPATGVLIGTVVDAATGKPVSGATVGISSWTGLNLPPQATALTGTDGRYMFMNLPAGQYNLMAQRGGYLPSSYGAISPRRGGVPVDLASGGRRTDLDIKMWKAGAISGRVTDDAGDPIVGISVQAWQRKPGGSGAADNWGPGPSATTDDRGVYRIKGLAPDGYLVFVEQIAASLPVSVLAEFQKGIAAANGPSSNPLVNEVIASRAGSATPGTATGRIVGDQVERLTGSTTLADSATRAAFVSQFYPSASTPKTASVVNVTSGDTRDGVDIQLRPVRTVTVSGTVQGPAGPIAHTRVNMAPQFATASDLTEASTVTDAFGRFTLLRVPEGAHVIEVLSVPLVPATSTAVVSVVQRSDGSTSTSSVSAPITTLPPLPPEETWHAAQPITTADKDMNDVVVTVRPGVRIGGRIQTPAGAVVPPATLSRIVVGLQRADGASIYTFGANPRTRIDTDGTLTSQGFVPGKYRVTANALPPGWMLSAVMHGAMDVSQEPLDLTSDVDDLVFTFTTTPSELSGVVRDSRNIAVPGALVMIFPADSPLTDESVRNPRRVVRPIATTTGAYVTKNLPPGDYFVAPMAPDDPENIESPAGGRFTVDSLTALRARATRVTIGAGEHRTLDLTTRAR